MLLDELIFDDFVEDMAAKVSKHFLLISTQNSTCDSLRNQYL